MLKLCGAEGAAEWRINNVMTIISGLVTTSFSFYSKSNTQLTLRLSPTVWSVKSSLLVWVIVFCFQPKVFFFFLSTYPWCMAVWQPANWPVSSRPALEQHHSVDEHPDGQHTATSGPPSKREEFKCITAHPLGSLRGELGHQTKIFLSHFLCMCLSHYFIFSPWIQSGQRKLRVERGVGNKSEDTPRYSVLFIAPLSTVNTVVTARFHICYMWETLWLAYWFGYMQHAQHTNEQQHDTALLWIDGMIFYSWQAK